jgi:hypothetical protein
MSGATSSSRQVAAGEERSKLPAVDEGDDAEQQQSAGALFELHPQRKLPDSAMMMAIVTIMMDDAIRSRRNARREPRTVRRENVKVSSALAATIIQCAQTAEFTSASWLRNTTMATSASRLALR